MFNMNNGYSLSDIAAVSGNNRNGSMWGDDGWWIILLFMFGLGGWGNGGWGGNNRGNCATQEEVRAAVDQQTLISKLDNQTYGLSDSTYALTNNLTNGFHGVDNAICNLGYQTQTGFNTLAAQMSNCCCDTQRGMERGFAELNYNLASQLCDTRRAIADNTRDIIENNNAGIRSIMDFLTQDKIASLQAENQALKFAASQQAQNTYLVNHLQPCPVPAYMVPNPNAAFYNCNCSC
jgi:hypothetical protein